MSEQPGRYTRSAGGMVGAMLVLVVLLLAWVVFRNLVSSEPSSPVRTVDYAKDVPAVKQAADFDLVAPPSLPQGWRATSVNFKATGSEHWHLGVLTDEDKYVGLEQGNESVRSMLEAYVDPDPSQGDPVDVAGRPWSTYSDDGGDLALVSRDGPTTTLVVGHEVDQAALVSYAASLR